MPNKLPNVMFRVGSTFQTSCHSFYPVCIRKFLCTVSPKYFLLTRHFQRLFNDLKYFQVRAFCFNHLFSRQQKIPAVATTHALCFTHTLTLRPRSLVKLEKKKRLSGKREGGESPGSIEERKREKREKEGSVGGLRGRRPV